MEGSNSFLTKTMGFVSEHIAYVLLGAGVLYFAILVVSIVHSRKHGGEVVIHFKYFVPFVIIIGLAVYCLATGQDLRQFIS